MVDIERIGIVGLGYVGLPTALAFHESGFSVTGVDVSERGVESLLNGESPLVDKTENLRIPIGSSRWEVGLDFTRLIDCDVILITVPTPVTEAKIPDLSFVKAASESVLNVLRRGSNTVVVLESTVYPGITRSILGGLCDNAGLIQGVDVTLAYCPERIDPGTPMGVGNIARIVGCDDPVVGESLASMYSKTTTASSTYVGKMEVAEASKMVENLQRDIDIALVNELALVMPRLGVDVEDVLMAAETKWNFKRFKPGIGVGGHCIPVDPYYYIQIAQDVGIDSDLALSARRINEAMPIISANEIKRILPAGSTVLILGYAYKADLGDTRETPVEHLADELLKSGLNPIIWDPVVPDEGVPARFQRVHALKNLPNIDLVILATAHSQIVDLDWREVKIAIGCSLIYDGRRSLDKHEMERQGWAYMGVGVSNV